MTTHQFLAASNGFAWTALISGAICYIIAVLYVIGDRAPQERIRNNWIVTGSVFLFVGLLISVAIGTVGLAQ